MNANYIRMTADTMEALPIDKQVEIYDFAKFLKVSTKKIHKSLTKKKTILNLVGIGESGIKDISLNHDKYLYE